MISIFNALRPAFQQLQYEEKVKRYEASLYPVILMIKGNFKRTVATLLFPHFIYSHLLLNIHLT